MQVQISGHHVDLTDPLRDYVNTKIERIERHFDHITNAHVTLTVEKIRNKAEANMHVSGAEIFAAAESDDMYAAIDNLMDKLDRQIIKHKEKRKSHKGPAAMTNLEE